MKKKSKKVLKTAFARLVKRGTKTMTKKEAAVYHNGYMAGRNSVTKKWELDRIATLEGENRELIDLLFVKDDEIRQLLIYKKFADDGHAYRITQKIQELGKELVTQKRRH